MKSLLRIAICWVILLAAVTNANAFRDYWAGPAGETNDWHDASNWSEGIPANSWVYINNDGTAVISASNAEAFVVSIAARDRDFDIIGGGLILSNKTLTTQNAFEMGHNEVGVIGCYNQYGHDSLLYVGSGLLIGREQECEGYFTLHDGSGVVDETSTTRNYITLGGEESPAKGFMTMLGGSIASKTFYCGKKGSGIYTQSGGTLNISENMYVAMESGSTGSVSISGGILNISNDVCIANEAGCTGSMTILGGSAEINVANNFDCTKGGSVHLTFILDGELGDKISCINCGKYAYINAANVTVEYKLGRNFHGKKDDEFILIEANNSIAANGCNFVDSTAGGDFEIKLDNNKRLYLVQHTDFPIEGTIIFVR
jgi:hypothetical protein